MWLSLIFTHFLLDGGLFLTFGSHTALVKFCQISLGTYSWWVSLLRVSAALAALGVCCLGKNSAKFLFRQWGLSACSRMRVRVSQIAPRWWGA